MWHMIMEQSFRMIVSVVTENSSLVTICTLTISSTSLCVCIQLVKVLLVHYCM